MLWDGPSAAAELEWGKTAPSAARSRDVFRASRRRVAIVAALAMGDCLAAAIAVTIGEVLGPSPGWNWSEGAIFAVLVPLHACLGLYGCWAACPIARLRLRALSACGLGAAALLLTSAWNSPADIAAIGLAGVALFVIGHYLEGLARLALMRNGLWGAPTVLIGAPERCAQLGRRLLDQPELGLLPIGFVGAANDVELKGTQPRDTVSTDAERSAVAPGDGAARPEAELPMLCGPADLHRLAGFAEVAILVSSDLARSDGLDAIRLSQLPFAHVIVAESAGDIPSLGLRTRNLGGALGMKVRFDLFRPGHLALKRMIDLAIAIPVALLAAPVVAILALAVKIADPGPAFYRQRRVGRDGRVLAVLKLRTMRCDAEERLREHLRDNPVAQAEWARFYKLSADPRVLPGIGNLLRRFSLDELPQLWNILCGEMSLVGPRPFPDYHMSAFDPAFQAWRVSVPPGLTGLWQVSSRSGGDIAVQREQDLFYIRNWSIWLDLYIIMETFPAVFTARGAK